LNNSCSAPDFEALEDAALLSKDKLLAGDIPTGRGCGPSNARRWPRSAPTLPEINLRFTSAIAEA